MSVLLTKVDLLGSAERSEVLEFVRAQLAKSFRKPPDVFPYSVRPGFECLKVELERNLIGRALTEFGAQHRSIGVRKIDTLLKESAEYLTLNLKSAESLDSQRDALKQQVLGEKQVIADIRSELRLIVGHAAGGTRTAIATRLETHQQDIEGRLLADFSSQFPAWTKSLVVLLSSFQEWLDTCLSRELSQISLAERSQLMEPLHRTSARVFRVLQEFRDRLSDRTSRTFGVPLRTQEIEVEIHEPRTPDVSVGRVFDRSWSGPPVLPVVFIKPMVRCHFARQVPYAVYKNISRSTSQWKTGSTPPC